MADRQAKDLGKVWLFHWVPIGMTPPEDLIHLMGTYPAMLHVDTHVKVVQMIADEIHAEHIYTPAERLKRATSKLRDPDGARIDTTRRIVAGSDPELIAELVRVTRVFGPDGAETLEWERLEKE